MTAAQIERGLRQLYSDETVRDELTDEEAAALLAWGEAQLSALAARDLDDTAFDEAYSQLRLLMTRVNRFTANRAYMAADEQQQSLEKIAASAQAFTSAQAAAVSAQAVPAAPDFSAYLEQQAALDNIANIEALTALVLPKVSVSVEQQGEKTHDETSQQTDDARQAGCAEQEDDFDWPPDDPI